MMENRELEHLEDRHPEYCQYTDEGCELASSCLNCPLPRCRYDEPGWRQQEAKEERDKEILRLRVGEGRSAAELARLFGLSKRTIHRIIRRDSSE